VKSKAGGSWVQVPIESKAPAPGTYDWPATASDKPDPKPGGKSKFVMTGTIPRVVVVAASGFPGNCPPDTKPIPGTDSPTTGGGTGGAGAAGAAKKAFTKLTIKHRSPFRGRVRSSEAACKDGRKVQLLKKRPKRKVGADRTGRNGKWRISGKRFSQGRFFARVKGTTVGNTTCTPARSRTIRLRA
jgi:hypothetical protein